MVSVDWVGNIFVCCFGCNLDLFLVMIGSYIDIQFIGGKFDGCFGVMVGFEVICIFNDFGVEIEVLLEVVVWINEEGLCFVFCMMGLGVFVGKFILEEILVKCDVDGVSVGEVLDVIGYVGVCDCFGYLVGVYFEVYIEQGLIFEDEEKIIGVVFGVFGQKWFDLFLCGVEVYVGLMLMYLCKDVLVGVVVVVEVVNCVVFGYQLYVCGMVGCLYVYFGLCNVIFGEVKMILDFCYL